MLIIAYPLVWVLKVCGMSPEHDGAIIFPIGQLLRYYIRENLWKPENMYLLDTAPSCIDWNTIHNTIMKFNSLQDHVIILLILQLLSLFLIAIRPFMRPF